MKILLVDDSTTMRRIQINVLAKLGSHELLEASDGVKALEVLEKEGPVDLVITDWNMPNMDGLTLLRAIREKYDKLPVVMITTEAEKVKIIEAIKCGVDAYVVKPFTPQVLSEKLEPFLKGAA
jgi:two-component system chemotaxis response regulator CheY